MKNILLIDDEREPEWIYNWNASKEELDEVYPNDPTYREKDVEVVRTGELGIEKLKEKKWDILLLDHDLGMGINGMDVIKFLEENVIDHPEYMPKKIYLVTANVVRGPIMYEIIQKWKGANVIEDTDWIR